MNHIIVGTAGHVDHGKTQLILCLTGINTDRLPEEKRRGMTIELGFVPLQLKNGQNLGLIDVPGHERFIKTMLAGAAGMDMALLVIAADEGVMPQTKEHLNILHLLGIDKGILVITKADLVEEEWLELIKEQVQELVSGTSLANAPLTIVSALTGQGIEELLQLLSCTAAQVLPKPQGGYARMPIDRVFSKTGFGTIVTGTLWQGMLNIGQNLEIWPQGQTARVRGLQVHGCQVEQAVAGQRTAVNVSGIPVGALPRGSWLAAPKLLKESWRLDVEIHLLPDVKPLNQRCRLRIHHGTAEVLGRLHLLDREELLPGARCFCQLLLEKPLPPLRQDKLILRSYSPMNVVGAATVLKADAARHKRYRPEIICAMENSLFADAGDVLLNALALGNSLYSANKLAQICQLPQKEIAPLLQNFGNSHKLAAFIIDGETHYTTTVKLNEWRNLLQKAAADHHQKYPLRLGLPLATARAQFFPAFSYKQLTILIEKWCSEGYFRLHNARLACADFLPLPCFEQKQWLESIEEDYINNLLDPPEWVKEMEQLKIPLFEQTELLLWLCEQGLLIKVAEGLYFHKQAIVFALEALQPLKNTGGFSLAQARDLWHTSRKYALPLLEYFDQEKITKRIADKRILL